MKYNKKIKALILDFDGTLLNSFNKSVKKHQELAEALDLRVPRKSEFRKAWLKGLPMREMIKKFWPENYKLFRQEYSKIYHKFKYRSFPGVIETLNKLKRDCLLIIASSRPNDHFYKRAEEAKIDLKIFFEIQLLEDTPYQKPDHRIYNRILKKLEKRRIKKQNVVCVGDTLADYEAARGAGLNFVGVLTGAATKKDFLKAGLSPRDIVQSVYNLPRYLNLYL